MGIAPAAATALGDDEILIGGHIHNDLIGLGIPHNSASGNLDDQILAPLAGHLTAQTVDTCLCSILALITEIQQRGHMVADTQHNAAAVTAVAAVRAAGSHVFFTVECHRTVAAATADDRDSNFIYKHRKSSFCRIQLTIDN